MFRSLLYNLAFALLFVALACGCGRKSSPAQNPASSSANPAYSRSPAPNAAEAPAAASPTATSNPALEGTVNEFMTAQLKIFIQEKGRVPADFGELARTRLDSVPRTPPGTYWAIDPATQEVKLVKQK